MKKSITYKQLFEILSQWEKAYSDLYHNANDAKEYEYYKGAMIALAKVHQDLINFRNFKKN